jgi:hypothetical protein
MNTSLKWGWANLLLGAFVLMAPVAILGAATLTVTNCNDSGPGSLRDTVYIAGNGDLIIFGLAPNDPHRDPQTGQLTITLGSEIAIYADELTIQGPGIGGSALAISGAGQHRVLNCHARIHLKNLTIKNGYANSGGGGGLFLTTDSTVDNCNFDGNVASGPDGGGAIFAAYLHVIYHTTITGCVFTRNSAPGGTGGALFMAPSQGLFVNVVNCILSNNTAERGGAIMVSHRLHVQGEFLSEGNDLSATSSRFIDNTASGAFSATGDHHGGAIFNGDGAHLSGCTFIGNQAQGGGAIYNDADYILGMSNCTLANNSVSFNGGGGGGAILNRSNFFASSLTISGNTADGYGGGIYNDFEPSGKPFSAGVTDNIIAGNHAGHGSASDVFGTFESQGYNLVGISNAGNGFTMGTDRSGTVFGPLDPRLSPLAYNGGSTETMALLPDSPAIDQGQGAGHANVDQRGYSRPYDNPVVQNAQDGADIGAFEAQATPAPTPSPLPCGGPTVVTNSDDGGRGSLRSIIATVCPGATITFASSVVSPINLTSGELVADKSLSIVGPGANLLTVQRSPASGTPPFRIFHVKSGGSNSISGLTISNGNPADYGGGGAILNEYFYGSTRLTITGCTISGNNSGSNATYNGGGGINNFAATLVLVNSTIAGNVATGSGGGIYNVRGTASVVNSTVSGNSALGSGGGGGVFNSDGSLNFIYDTIAYNSAAKGAGIYNDDTGDVRAGDTLVARNTSTAGSDDFFGSFKSDGFNLIGNTTDTNVTGDSTGNQLNVDPKLGPLQDNGGPTLTHALLPGSPALDGGTYGYYAGRITNDQRAFSRPVDLAGMGGANGGDNSDIGAFELSSLPTTPTPTPTATATATPTAAPRATTTPTPNPTSTPTLSPRSSTLLNISTRLRVLTNDNALIGGFIVTGNESKKVIIRGIGPSLANSGIQEALANPILELHQGNLDIGSNDNWKDTQQAEIEASTLAPGDDLESAIVATLAPGAYTAVLRGKNDTIGVGLIEVYDLAQGADAKLANISTRGFVDTGDSAMIGGFIAGGDAKSQARVVVRGIGPSLEDFGVGNALSNPTLELHDGQGAIIQFNDDWKEGQQTEIVQLGLAPTKDAESALLATLSPGNYTAIVRGKANSTGVALVEVYNVQ